MGLQGFVVRVLVGIVEADGEMVLVAAVVIVLSAAGAARARA